jgi:hypothetical protein
MRLSYRTRVRLLFWGITLRARVQRALRPVRRLALAVRYVHTLNYSWRLAWAAAERS